MAIVYMASYNPDGSGNWDQAFMEAANDATAGGSNPGTILMSAMTYKIGGTLDFSSYKRVSLIGAGCTETHIAADFSSAADIMIIDADDGAGVVLRDFLIRPYNLGSNNTRSGIILRDTHRWVIERVFTEFIGHSINDGVTFKFENSYSGAIKDCQADNSYWVMDLSQGSNGITATSLSCTGFKYMGCRITDAYQTTLNGCEFAAAESESSTFALIIRSTKTSIDDDLTYGLAVNGGLYIGNQTAIIIGEADSLPVAGVSITGAVILGVTPPTGIIIKNAQGVSIIGNRIIGANPWTSGTPTAVVVDHASTVHGLRLGPNQIGGISSSPNGSSRWKYYCTVDGTDQGLGEFDYFEKA